MKKVLLSRLPIAALAASLILATGCASLGSRSAPPPPPAAPFVAKQMDGTIHSIERSLQVLVELERGDEGPRKTTALGSTVAGAAGPDLAPVAMPVVAVPASPLGQARIEHTRMETRNDLATRVRLAWTGSAEELLRELSGRVGFSFGVSGPGFTPIVHVNHEQATVEQVLRDVAAQIDTHADIKVDTATRRVTLVYKAGATR